jgi:CheY-like chemotaxis protein
MADGATILVVDDHPMVRDIVRIVLASAGFRPVCAEHGAAALALFESNVVDGAIIDVDMPGMNGIEVCERLQAAAAARHQPLVAWIMTGVLRPELMGAARRAGALGILAKPFTRSELVACFDVLEAPRPAVPIAS